MATQEVHAQQTAERPTNCDMRPRVGVGVLVFNEAGEVLLGKRRNSHGAGEWSPPGGHLEFGESFIECALRELAEEAGIIALEATFVGVTNDIFAAEQKHYVSIFMEVVCSTGREAQVCEPEKMIEWRWFALDALPEPLFLPLAHWVEQHKKGSL